MPTTNMIEIAIIIFLGLILIGIGVIIDRLFREDNKNGWLKIDKVEGNTITLKEPLEESSPVNAPIAVLSQDDVINHEGVGIVHRPSAEEIAKMNEPQRVREAKEAVAETIASVPEPI